MLTFAVYTRFNCHINVESSVSFASFKYIHKYVHKGPDRATVQLGGDATAVDEISEFIDARYVTAPEAVWRILQNTLHEQVPNVIRLQLHLPGQHMVVYNPNEDLATICQRAANEKTMLTAFFETNRREDAIGSFARRLTYQEFPQHFVWNREQKTWTHRQRGYALGRIYFAGPTGGERFYLRLLLTAARGPRSFEDLRTYNGVVHPTFKDACIARGLLEDDGEWRMCLTEAAYMQTGSRLRQLFATILVYCEPMRPEALWNEFREHICDDLRYKLTQSGFPQPTDDDVYDYGLYLLDILLRESSRSLDDFHSMPKPRRDWSRHVSIPNRFIAEQLNYHQDREREAAARHIQNFNADQQHAFDTIMTSVRNEDGHQFFLNGPGGTGKTYVYIALCHTVRAEAWIALCVASSGISALLLPGGRTSHSTFKIPVDGLTDESSCSIPKQGHLAAMLRLVRLIIWDEVPMQHRFGPEAVDRALRDIRNDDRPFGGITVVFGGDFQQTLPVVPRGSREQIVEACLQASPLWQYIRLLSLRQNMRVRHEEGAIQFADWLLDIGHGRLNTGPNNENVTIPDHMKVPDLNSLIEFVYPRHEISAPTPPPAHFFRQRTILSARNQDVTEINNIILNQMPGEERVYLSADTVLLEPGADVEVTSRHARPRSWRRRRHTSASSPPVSNNPPERHTPPPRRGNDDDSESDESSSEHEDAPLFEPYGQHRDHHPLPRPAHAVSDEHTAYPPEFLRSLSASGLPPGELRLKVGAPLILLRNLAPSRGLCNGTRMVVVRMSDRALEVRIMGGDHDGELAMIPRIPLIPTDNNGEFAFRLRRRQFPVRLAFAMTINKAQGQSVDYVGLDLRTPVFSHGQLYVAFSRATSGQRVKVLLADNAATQTSNIVYPEVLLD